tara:strand:- start:3044 stop:3415 length:372 start_codon:yes stop_codon:yes gene_type:complete
MKRSGPIQRKTPMRKVSKKRQKIQGQRRNLVREQLAVRPHCEAGEPIYMYYVNNFGQPYARERRRTDQCQGRATDIHEPLMRSRGGSILDLDNTVAVCRRCHNWIHENPAVATELGLLRSAQK